MNRSKSEILKYIEVFADQAHGNQVRKYTRERYIVHPVRVMKMVSEYNDDVCVLAAALLHDVLEDTAVTSEEIEKALQPVLKPGQVQTVSKLVVELTDIFIKSDYPRLNRQVRREKEALRLGGTSPEAQTIKYADIIDNVTDIVTQDRHFAKTFVREANRMLAVMDAGDPVLRQRAMEQVEGCLNDLRKRAELY